MKHITPTHNCRWAPIGVSIIALCHLSSPPTGAAGDGAGATVCSIPMFDDSPDYAAGDGPASVAVSRRITCCVARLLLW